MVSTRDGKQTALERMMVMSSRGFPEPLYTAAGIVMVIRRLEELQCLNTVKVVIMWAWSIGVVNPMDHDGWQLIGHDTHRFCQTHGVEHMVALKQHIAGEGAGSTLYRFVAVRIGRSWPGARDFVGLPVQKLEPNSISRFQIYLCLSRACQLRRLYRLFGYDSVTWDEAIEAVDVDEDMGVLSERLVMPAPFVDWACDYP